MEKEINIHLKIICEKPGRETNFENFDFLPENVPNGPTRTGAGAAVIYKFLPLFHIVYCR